MTKSWTWVGGNTARRSADNGLRVGVTASRRELTTSTVIVTGSTGRVDAGITGHAEAGSTGHAQAGSTDRDDADLAHHPVAGFGGYVDAGFGGYIDAGFGGRREVGSNRRTESALLVDPAWDPDELAWIGRSLAAEGIMVTAGFSTHAHHDHLLWHSGLPRVPRWASESTSTEAQKNRDELLAELGPDWSGELADEVGAVTGLPGPLLPWAGTEITMITHNAHAPGHTALWVPAVRVLIAGDMLSEIELPLLEESSPADYLQGLDALWPFVNAATVIIPGHGTPASGAQCVARWVADRGYLDALISGADPIDRRRDLRGMAQAHRANLERAAGG